MHCGALLCDATHTQAEGNFHGLNSLINGTEGDAACWKVVEGV